MAQELLQEVGNILQIVAPYLLPLAGVWLGWWLNSNSQRRERRLDRLRDRFDALRQVKHVAENVPPDVGAQELRTRLESDEQFRRNLSGRLVRLFGLRTELIPFMDHELVDFIDKSFRPLYVIGTGTYDLRDSQIEQFAAAAAELRQLVARIEHRMVVEYERLRK